MGLRRRYTATVAMGASWLVLAAACTSGTGALDAEGDGGGEADGAAGEDGGLAEQLDARAPNEDGGSGPGAPLRLVWYGASTTEFGGSTSGGAPQAGYAVPALVAGMFEAYSGSPGPVPRVWTAGGTPLSLWRARDAWSDATGGSYDYVVSTVVRVVAPTVSPPGESNELVAASAEIQQSNFMVWAPVQPQRSGEALASYLACTQENATLAGHTLHVAPVAQAMQAARDLGFVLNNGDADGSANPHYTRAGAYVVALTIFAYLYEVSPVGLEVDHVFLGSCAAPSNRASVQCQMSDDEGRVLQEVAHDAVMAAAPTASCAAFCADVSTTQPVCPGG